MLNQTLEHLRRAVPIPSRRAAVLFCPALTEARYGRERQPLSSVARFLGSRHRDFILGQPLLSDWAAYRRLVVEPSAYFLEAIERRTEARVIPEATFEVFKKALFCGYFDVLFVVSHHPNVPGAEGLLHFEFADGAYSLDEVAAEANRLDASQPVSTVFFSCQSRQVQSGLYGRFPGLESVGFADWNVPLNEGLAFLQLWVEGLDGERTLAEAWDFAVRTVFLKIGN